MYTKERLIRGEGYWMETIQQAIHEALLAYMEKHGLNQTELAGKLGFTRGYVSQLMNGNFNLSQRKIIQLLLKLDMVPDLRIRSMDDYLASSKASEPTSAPRRAATKPTRMAAAVKVRALRRVAKRASK